VIVHACDSRLASSQSCAIVPSLSPATPSVFRHQLLVGLRTGRCDKVSLCLASASRVRAQDRLMSLLELQNPKAGTRAFHRGPRLREEHFSAFASPCDALVTAQVCLPLYCRCIV
jgi:hypothetical protein